MFVSTSYCFGSLIRLQRLCIYTLLSTVQMSFLCRCMPDLGKSLRIQKSATCTPSIDKKRICLPWVPFLSPAYAYITALNKVQSCVFDIWDAKVSVIWATDAE